MNIVFTGHKSPDKQWYAMRAAWDACREAGIKVPSEVTAYFAGKYPANEPVIDVDIKRYVQEITYSGGKLFEINIKTLPSAVNKVQVFIPHEAKL